LKASIIIIVITTKLDDVDDNNTTKLTQLLAPRKKKNNSILDFSSLTVIFVECVNRSLIGPTSQVKLCDFV